MGKSVAKKDAAGAVGFVSEHDLAGAGFENVTAADISIPFLYLLQNGSGPVKDKVLTP